VNIFNAKSGVNLVFLMLLSISVLVGCGSGSSGGNGVVGGAGRTSDQDLVQHVNNQIPPVGDNMCGLGLESIPITASDCVANNESFYNGTDATITYILGTYGKWLEEDTKQLLSIQDPTERYTYFLLHNRGPLTLQCDKGLENKEQGCKTALFGNSQFQIDYLLCPNLVNKYFVLASKDWTTRLNQVFVYCAAHNELPNQCQSTPRVLVTQPELLKIGNYYTYTAKELCIFTNVDGLNLYPRPSQARYSIFNISQ